MFPKATTRTHYCDIVVSRKGSGGIISMSIGSKLIQKSANSGSIEAEPHRSSAAEARAGTLSVRVLELAHVTTDGRDLETRLDPYCRNRDSTTRHG